MRKSLSLKDVCEILHESKLISREQQGFILSQADEQTQKLKKLQEMKGDLSGSMPGFDITPSDVIASLNLPDKKTGKHILGWSGTVVIDVQSEHATVFHVHKARANMGMNPSMFSLGSLRKRSR